MVDHESLDSILAYQEKHPLSCISVGWRGGIATISIIIGNLPTPGLWPLVALLIIVVVGVGGPSNIFAFIPVFQSRTVVEEMASALGLVVSSGWTDVQVEGALEGLEEQFGKFIRCIGPALQQLHKFLV